MEKQPMFAPFVQDVYANPKIVTMIIIINFINTNSFFFPYINILLKSLFMLKLDLSAFILYF